MNMTEKQNSKGDLLKKDVVRGLIYTHNRVNKNTSEVHQANATIQALIELLVEREILNKEELANRRSEKSEELRKAYVQKGMTVAMQEFRNSKYEFKGDTEIDCHNHIHLCKAACCKLPLALSKEDVQENIVKWDLGHPYMINHGKDGYCTHMKRANYHCTIYEHRSIPCRGYDCRKDKRVWLEFEEKILNPRLDEADWPECLEEEKETSVISDEKVV